MVDKSYLRWNSKIVSDVTVPLLMTHGIEHTFSRPFSETFRISKNEDFNGPYLENKNEFLKNSFETVFRASKSCDRGQLVSAFQLTFNIVTAGAGTANGTSGIMTFGEKDPNATLLYI